MPAGTSTLVTRNVRIGERPAEINDLDIYRSADVLMKQHGQDAPLLSSARERK